MASRARSMRKKCDHHYDWMVFIFHARLIEQVCVCLGTSFSERIIFNNKSLTSFIVIDIKDINAFGRIDGIKCCFSFKYSPISRKPLKIDNDQMNNNKHLTSTQIWF